MRWKKQTKNNPVFPDYVNVFAHYLHFPHFKNDESASEILHLESKCQNEET